MKNHYTKELLITSTYSDRFCELGLTQATLLLQDAMTELFYTYQCDAIRLSQSHQVIWAVARTKLRYDGPIRWMDRVKQTVYIFINKFCFNLFGRSNPACLTGSLSWEKWIENRKKYHTYYRCH